MPLAVQPRGYGEHSITEQFKGGPPGSAPWVRGTRFPPIGYKPPVRFSPVGTGNTRVCSAKVWSPTVQPRGYGEHSYCTHSVAQKVGSAPWVRGTQLQSIRIDARPRFSPVGTGNTASLRSQRPTATVQPRGYGEHVLCTARQGLARGSAPWVRGTLALVCRTRSGLRFSPVGTGNTPLHNAYHHRNAVQPRGYGEHLFAHTSRNPSYGSAPWVRGTQEYQQELAAMRRFSPVGTGNTPLRSASSVCLAVQPRGYGEHWCRCDYQ